MSIEEEQTTQWSKEKVQKDKQRSTKYTYKTKDRVTRTPLITGSEIRCSGRLSSSCSTSDTHRVTHIYMTTHFSDLVQAIQLKLSYEPKHPLLVKRYDPAANTFSNFLDEYVITILGC